MLMCDDCLLYVLEWVVLMLELVDFVVLSGLSGVLVEL